MSAYIITILIIAFFSFLVVKARKKSKKGESKLSVFEHPSTFKKPEIEMVNTVQKDEEDKLNAHKKFNPKNQETSK